MHGLTGTGVGLIELKGRRAHALNKADKLVALGATRELTVEEENDYQNTMLALQTLKGKIAVSEERNTLRITDSGLTGGGASHKHQPDYERKVLSASYWEEFHDWIASGGEKMGATLYEGASSTGGYAVPSMVDGLIVPLAPQEMAVRQIARVIPTTMTIQVPVKGSFGTAASKVESGASPVAFPESDPTLSTFALSAFMVGNRETVSWELAQDVPLFQQFVVSDLIAAIQMLEENWFVTGTGTEQPQGLIGNVGAGVTGYPANGSTLLDATFDVQGTLNGQYWPNSSWLMQRATGVALKKLQKQANLFEAVFSNVNGQDYLHGRPVYYSASMPAIGASATPILFGDFAQGYVIGDRGGSGINIKILDQPMAIYGQLVLLGYRRVDGRVRRSEAIQSITLASS